MTAIIAISGKQYRVKAGSTLVVDQLKHAVGETMTYDDLLGGQSVKAKIVEHKLGNKVMTLRFRNKSRYNRTVGHRQRQTVLTIVSDEGQNKK